MSARHAARNLVKPDVFNLPPPFSSYSTGQLVVYYNRLFTEKCKKLMYSYGQFAEHRKAGSSILDKTFIDPYNIQNVVFAA